MPDQNDDPSAPRERRASQLAPLRPHAAELLAQYLKILALQRPLYRRAGSWRWLREIDLPSDERPTPLAALPAGRLDARFRRFVSDLGNHATETLVDAATSLDRSSRGERAELLRRVAGLGDLDELAAALGCEVAPLVFFTRAFLQPIAEAWEGQRVRRDPAAPHERLDVVAANGTPENAFLACPLCGWPPQVSVLRDEPETRGSRRLVCGLCAHRWRFPRVMCPACGEARSPCLVQHESEDFDHVSVEECRSCSGYIKSVDLRRDGAADPLVDDLATVELDLWSQERGLWKVSRNLMGL